MQWDYLPDFYVTRAKSAPGDTQFLYYDNQKGAWAESTWGENLATVYRVIRHMQRLGVGKGDCVAILSANRPEWILVDMAIMLMGAVSVPIYATSSESDVGYILDHANAKLIFVDNKSRSALIPQGSEVVQILFDDVMASGFAARITQESDEPLCFSREASDIASIIYTSGTTGTPKGVVHSHGNFKACLESVHQVVEPPEGTKDTYFSFLPLSHVAERVFVGMCPLIYGSKVGFARSINHLAEDLPRVRPTMLLCVPRMWEKMYEKIMAGVGKAPAVKRMLFRLARRMGESAIVGGTIYPSKPSFGRQVADRLVGRALRERLGFDRLRFGVTGSAPTRDEILRFYGAFGISILEVYGLTENLCLGTVNDRDRILIDSCGSAFPGCQIRIAPDGEIMFKAPYNFEGYYKNEEATKECLQDGWFLTGDLGSLDSEGNLRITGRKKELLKTSGGKYVAPVPLEERIKLDPAISEAMVVGDSRKYCVALVVLDREVLGPLSTEQIRRRLEDHLDEVNEGLAGYESIKKLGVMLSGFSVEEGTLTPTLKLKRARAAEKTAHFVERLYSATTAVVFEGEEYPPTF